MLTKEENDVFRIADLENGYVGKAITCFVLDGDHIANVSRPASKQDEGAQ